ncbi:hypothetical protein ACQP1P_46465 [Dactylosporangium sp. CA-052675]|uniref:hypothetical protein n=1 Tax=Dactylosporangium sp. CA-052675 TaxID=3239927 RepID=UPI003D8A6740
MSHRSLPVVIGCTAVILSGCGGDKAPAPRPSAAAVQKDLVLTAGDLPDGYATSPPDATPEVSAASSSSIPGCDPLLDLFQTGPRDAARFEAGSTGPFLAESLADGTPIADMAARCATFTDTDGDGETTHVSVDPVGDFPAVAESQKAFMMEATGGTGDDAWTTSGYLVQLRVDGLTCTLVHFGQPGVDRAETESIAKAAVAKIKRRQ